MSNAPFLPFKKMYLIYFCDEILNQHIMAKEKTIENQEEKKETPPAEAPKSKREQFREYMKNSYPDDDFDDEDTRYGRVMEALEMNQKMKDSDSKMKDLFDKHPQYKDMFMKAAQGEDFIESFIAVFGKDSILEAINNPEAAEKLSKAQEQYIKTQADNEKYKKDSDVNIGKSLKDFTAFAKENNLNSEQTNEVWGKCIDIIVNGINGILDRSLFETVLKGMNYDNAVQTAQEEGRIQGRNENIEATLAKSAPEKTPPTFGGGAGAPVKPETPKQKRQYYNVWSGQWEDLPDTDEENKS